MMIVLHYDVLITQIQCIDSNLIVVLVSNLILCHFLLVKLDLKRGNLKYEDVNINVLVC